MNELSIKADTANLYKVLDMIGETIDGYACPTRTKSHLDVAVEEIFVNIANYAYGDDTGDAFITADVSGEPPTLTVTFRDSGMPYDPLKKPDPDVTLSADERRIGGLGIFMVKKTMDDMIYEYKDGQNVLTIKKTLV